MQHGPDQGLPTTADTQNVTAAMQEAYRVQMMSGRTYFRFNLKSKCLAPRTHEVIVRSTKYPDFLGHVLLS